MQNTSAPAFQSKFSPFPANMLIPQVYQSEFITPSLLNLRRKTSLCSHYFSNKSIAPRPRIATTPTTITASIINNLETISIRSIETIANPLTLLQNYKSQSVDLKATVSVKVIAGGLTPNLEDNLSDELFGTSFELVLVSSQASAGSAEGQRVRGFAKKISIKRREVKYECDFKLPAGFGEVGAILVKNENTKEMFFNNIVLTSSGNPTVTLTCNSWVSSKDDNPHKRIFFTDKSYLPSQTPSGIKKLRDQELENLRGDGQGERKTFDRIYDYATYNDLGNPDSSPSKRRPVLGGPIHPYPRRCRTGRGPTNTDPLSEKVTPAPYYVPRDEAFSAVKDFNFQYSTLRGVIRGVIPFLETALVNPDLGFPSFTRIDTLYDDGIPLPDNEGIYKYLLPRLIKKVEEGLEEILLFEPPELMNRDKFSWFRDKEFARQTLAGLNPLSIQLVTEWPMKSKLDPDIYGPAESDITKEIVEREINGVMTLEEALEQKKLFVIDYNDLLLPYVKKVRELEGTTLYGSRTLFFLNENNTLMPIAIELTCPVIDNKPEWRHVFTPSLEATDLWLWRFAKAQVLAHDSGYHELVSHWLRTHCCMEPYIIAANRHLSAMHPIYKLLHPHFRYTMEINALAREALINADGIIESCFSPGRYSMELSSAAYGQLWRFDMEALPADLIRRGMAVEDRTAEHGVKLTIEDYPFANDGLLLWDAIKTWVTDYVNHYYQDAKSVETDTELQAWWTEVRTKGHADKKDEPWWPVLDTKDSLVHTLSTIIWVASGHHAAVNFGQYDYAGYVPNRPTIARTNVPIEDPTEAEFKNFIAKPEAELLKCFPSQIQAVKVMAVLDVLSTHSPDEEYIGDKLEPYWSEDPVIKAAFDLFKGRLTYMNGIIEARNADPKLKNRIGAGVVSYELLKQLSKPGVTGMGVPNSISI